VKALFWINQIDAGVVNLAVKRHSTSLVWVSKPN